MITTADIEQVVGVAAKVQPGDRLHGLNVVSMCTYEAAADSRTLVGVLVRVGDPGLDAETNSQQYVDGLKMNMGDSYQIDPVEGLDGPAVWNQDMKQLTVFEGHTLVILTLFDGADGEPLRVAKQLGEIALARI